MTVYFSVLSISEHARIQDFVSFLAFISLVSWVAVLAACLFRVVVRMVYERKTKRVRKGSGL